MREIGGEFYSYDVIHSNNGNVKIEKETDSVYTLSGRTSIDYIIKDILVEYDINRAFLPSYCCDCMIEPFFGNGIEVDFYDIFVGEDGGLIYNSKQIDDLEGKNAILLAMDYFGFNRNLVNNIFESVSDDVIKIEDKTHSFFSQKKKNKAMYDFASIRKWTKFNGLSVCNKIEGEFNIRLNDKCWKGVGLRQEAAILKSEYIKGNNKNKNTFLELFNTAEKMLDIDYCLYQASCEDIRIYNALDGDLIKRKRRENASILIEELKDMTSIDLIYKNLNAEDCPLFVPIIVKGNMRDKLRKHLIEKDIYCPVHWPLSKYHRFSNTRAIDLYSCELSLICDQRYSKDDMERIVCEIKDFFDKI